MSQSPFGGGSNGARPSVPQASLVIDTVVERHLLLRRAIRQTALFSVILSAESVETARDILADAQTPQLALILIQSELADPVLAKMTADQIKRSAVVADAPVSDTLRPVLVSPADANDIARLLEALG